MYWKLKAKHGLCGAHLVRDLAEVATVASQRAWAAGLAALLVEVNAACDDAERYAHLRSYLSTTRKHGVPAIDALTRLFNGDPSMPPPPGT